MKSNAKAEPKCSVLKTSILYSTDPGKVVRSMFTRMKMISKNFSYGKLVTLNIVFSNSVILLNRKYHLLFIVAGVKFARSVISGNVVSTIKM